MRQVRLLAGRYRVLGRLSAGPKGALWLAEEASSHRPVIVAQISEAKAQWLNPGVGVSHAHLAQIVRVVRPVVRAELPLGEGEPAPEAVAVAELVAGRTLAQALLNTPLPPFQAVRCVAYIASAVDALHRRGATHGAISQRSVVLERADQGPSPVLMQLNEPPNVAFASPERLQGGGPSQQDDVWALHVLLYAALTGRPPFRGGDAETVLRAVHSTRPAQLRATGVRDDRLQDIVDRGLRVDWSERIRSVFDLETELFDWLSQNTPKDSERPQRPAIDESGPKPKDQQPATEPEARAIPRAAPNPRTATLRYGATPEELKPAPPPAPEPQLASAEPAIPDLDLPPPSPPRPAPAARDDVGPSADLVPELVSAVVTQPASVTVAASKADRQPGPPLGDARASAPEITVGAPEPVPVRPVAPEPKPPAKPAPEPAPEADAPATPKPAAKVPPAPPPRFVAPAALDLGAPPADSTQDDERAWAAFKYDPGPDVNLSALPAPRTAEPAKQRSKAPLVAAVVVAVAGGTLAALGGGYLVARSMGAGRAAATTSTETPADTPPPAPSSAQPAASPAASTPQPDEPPKSSEPEDITSCVSAFFPDGTFDGLQDLAFVCEHRDARKGARIMRSRIVIGARGNITDAMREWSRLEWHEIAAYAIFRHACCPSPEPLDLPPPVRSCSAVGTTADALAKAFVDEDPKFDERLVQFHRAADCAHYGNAPGYNYPAGPISGGQVAFAAFLERNLKRRKAR